MHSVSRSVLVLFLAIGTADAADPSWIRVQSPHFDVYSTTGEKTARDALRHFELVQTFCVDTLLGGSTKALPVRIVVSSEPAPAERDYIAISGTGQQFPAAVREYILLVMRQSGVPFPAWMKDGLAELYSTLKPLGDNVLVGSLIEFRVRRLNQDQWVPLSVILNAERDAPETANESWALLHMLALSKDYRPGFEQLCDLLRSGTPPVLAIEKAYGKPLAVIETDLQSYMRSDRFRGVFFPSKISKGARDSPATNLSAADVKLALSASATRPRVEDPPLPPPAVVKPAVVTPTVAKQEPPAPQRPPEIRSSTPAVAKRPTTERRSEPTRASQPTLAPEPSRTPEPARPKIERRERPEFQVAQEPTVYSTLPSMKGTFVSFECTGAKPRVVIQTEAGKKSFAIDDPNNIVVEGKKGGSVHLTCGAQSPARVRVVYVAAEKPSGPIVGTLKGLYYEP